MMKNWKVGLTVAGGILVIAVAAGAFINKDAYLSESDQTQAKNSAFTTIFLEQKDLKTYESFNGTLKYEDDIRIITAREGVLTYLAPEGQELTRGAEIYRIYHSPGESELLAADQQIVSADANVAQAELALENLNSPATTAQIASADANVAQAELALENLNSPATAAQIASADANVAQAELAFENLNSPATAAQIASADANIAQAELAFENLNSPATTAQIGTADVGITQAESNLAQGKNTVTSTDAARLIARQSLCTADKQDEASWLCPDNLRGELFPDNLITSLIDMISNNILSAEANNLLNTQKNYEAALDSQRVFEKNLEQALNNKLALDETPTEAELLQATRSLNSATSSLNIALQNRKDLVEGYSASLLMFGDLSVWRDMKEGIGPGEDINQLKLNLIALGYGTTETLEVDSTFDPNTTTAIMKLQSDLNLISSGEVIFGEIIFASGTSMVNSSSTLQNRGEKINTGVELFSLTPIEKISSQIGSDGAINIASKSLQKIEIQVGVADQNLVVKGSEVEIELPDESTIVGLVDEVGSFAVVPQDGDPFLEISIAVEGSTEYFKWTGAVVTVNATKELAKGVLASPVNGLLALLSGGYALEIITKTGTTLVPVETGIYADGWVEIHGSGLQPGTEIIVPNQ